MSKKKKKKKKKKSTRSVPRAPTGPGFESLDLIHGLELPLRYRELWESGLWRQPTDSLIDELIPWLTGPIEFILDYRQIREASLGKLADIPMATKYYEYRGSNSDTRPDLPWLDVDLHVMIAHNRHWGDDLGIALDYRSSMSDPRVVGSKWISTSDKKFDHVEWTIVAETFSEFAQSLGYET